MDFVRSYRLDIDRDVRVIPCGPDLVSNRRPVRFEPFRKTLWDVGSLGMDDRLYRVQNSLNTPICQISRCECFRQLEPSKRECLEFQEQHFLRLRQPLQP